MRGYIRSENGGGQRLSLKTFTMKRSRCVGGHEVPSSMQLAVVKEVGIGPLIQVSTLRKST